MSQEVSRSRCFCSVPSPCSPDSLWPLNTRCSLMLEPMPVCPPSMASPHCLQRRLCSLSTWSTHWTLATACRLTQALLPSAHLSGITLQWASCLLVFLLVSALAHVPWEHSCVPPLHCACEMYEAWGSANIWQTREWIQAPLHERKKECLRVRTVGHSGFWIQSLQPLADTSTPWVSGGGDGVEKHRWLLEC